MFVVFVMPGGPKTQGWHRKGANWGKPVPKAKAKGKAKPQQVVVVKQQPVASRKKKKNKAKKGGGASLARTFDPRNGLVPPHMLTIGRCFPIKGMTRLAVATSPTTSTMLFVTCLPSTGTFGGKVNWTIGSASAGTFAYYRSPMIQTAAASGGASSIKASKVSLEVENTTQLLNVQGLVYVANLDQRMLWAGAPITMTGLQWDAIAASIKSFPETRAFPAKTFLRPQRYFAHVVDDVDYNMFDNNVGDVDMNAIGKHIAVWSYPEVSEEKARPMSTLVVLFEATNTDQDYTTTGTVQHLTRWPLSTVAGQAMKDVPASDPSTVNAARRFVRDRGGISR